MSGGENNEIQEMGNGRNGGLIQREKEGSDGIHRLNLTHMYGASETRQNSGSFLAAADTDALYILHTPVWVNTLLGPAASSR